MSVSCVHRSQSTTSANVNIFVKNFISSQSTTLAVVKKVAKIMVSLIKKKKLQKKVYGGEGFFGLIGY